MMRRTVWIAVALTAAVLGGARFVPVAGSRAVFEDVVLALLTLTASVVLYRNFPVPVRQAIRGEVRRGRPWAVIARRHRWPVDAVRALAEGNETPQPAAGAPAPDAAGAAPGAGTVPAAAPGRPFRSSGRPRRPRLGAARPPRKLTLFTARD